MTRPINGELVVGSFTPSGNPGEYLFDAATFNNQADATGNGAYDVQVGFALFVPASDVNTFMQVPGVVHRYKLTALVVIDPNTLSGTMLWDEVGDEQDVPTNGVSCLLAEPTANRHLALPPIDSVYSGLTAGTTIASMLSDLKNLVDQPQQGGSGGVVLKRFDFVDTLDWTVQHNMNTTTYQVSLYNADGSPFSAYHEPVSLQAFQVNVLVPLTGYVVVVFAI